MAGDTPGKDVHSRWTFLTSPIGCKKVNQEYVHQDEMSMPSAAAPGKYFILLITSGMITRRHRQNIVFVYSHNTP